MAYKKYEVCDFCNKEILCPASQDKAMYQLKIITRTPDNYQQHFEPDNLSCTTCRTIFFRKYSEFLEEVRRSEPSL